MHTKYVHTYLIQENDPATSVFRLTYALAFISVQVIDFLTYFVKHLGPKLMIRNIKWIFRIHVARLVLYMMEFEIGAVVSSVNSRRESLIIISFQHFTEKGNHTFLKNANSCIIARENQNGVQVKRC